VARQSLRLCQPFLNFEADTLRKQLLHDLTHEHILFPLAKRLARSFMQVFRTRSSVKLEAINVNAAHSDMRDEMDPNWPLGIDRSDGEIGGLFREVDHVA